MLAVFGASLRAQLASKSKTPLADRVLWADGVSEVKPEEVMNLLERGVPASCIAVTEVTSDLLKFNQLSNKPILTKSSLNKAFPPRWVIPDQYKYLDLVEHLVKLAERIERDDLYEQRLKRLVEEIDLYLRLGYHDLLRALIYIVDEFERQQVVWGVGRGSSCSSYLLYLLGLHEVDSVKYEIPISDFIREHTQESTCQEPTLQPAAKSSTSTHR
jgi:DNA polymerase III alpha subunit